MWYVCCNFSATIVPFIVTSLTLFIYELYICDDVKSDMPIRNCLYAFYVHCSWDISGTFFSSYTFKWTLLFHLISTSAYTDGSFYWWWEKASKWRDGLVYNCFVFFCLKEHINWRKLVRLRLAQCIQSTY